MNLIEVLAAGLVFSGAAAGSLQVLASAGRWSRQGEERQGIEERQEELMLAATLEARRFAAEAAPRAGSCELAAGALRQRLAAVAPEAELAEAAAGRGVLLRVALEGGRERQRLLLPAALGLCDPVEAGTDGGAG